MKMPVAPQSMKAEVDTWESGKVTGTINTGSSGDPVTV